MKTEDYPSCWNCDCLLTIQNDLEFCPECNAELAILNQYEEPKENILADFYGQTKTYLEG